MQCKIGDLEHYVVLKWNTDIWNTFAVKMTTKLTQNVCNHL